MQQKEIIFISAIASKKYVKANVANIQFYWGIYQIRNKNENDNTKSFKRMNRVVLFTGKEMVMTYMNLPYEYEM